MALGLQTYSSSIFEYDPGYPAIESYAPSSSGGAFPTTRFTFPAITRQTSIALSPRAPTPRESCALPLLAVVHTPFFPASPDFGFWKPWRMIVQTPQPGTEPQRLEEPWEPREQASVVQWKRRSSLPSAAQREAVAVAVARILMVSRQSSKRWIVRRVLLTFKIRSIVKIGWSLFCQLDLNIISTIFRPESSSPSSDTIQIKPNKNNLH